MLFRSTAATDQIKFILQYVYCDNVMLASEITSFTASRKNDYIDLHWLASNELPNHNYEVQKSYDGKNFVAVTTVASNPGTNQTGNYQYNYVPQPGENGKLYFRIRQAGLNGTSKFSPVRIVDPAASDERKDGMRLVPNPSKGIFSIMLENAAISDWNIDLFNIRGQVICRKQAKNSALTKFSINETLSAGVYFVIVTNKKNNQKFVERMIVN